MLRHTATSSSTCSEGGDMSSSFAVTRSSAAAGTRQWRPTTPRHIPASPFGPRLVSVVAMMTGVFHLSRRNTQRFLREVFEIRMSIGAISQAERRVSKALAPASEQAHDDVLAAMVKHTDATTWLIAGVTMSLWTLCTALTSVFRIFKDGARATIESMFSDGRGNKTGFLVSDRASVFGFWEMALRQVCWAHLLRLFVGFSQRAGPEGAYGRELLEHAAIVFEYWHDFVAGTRSRDELRHLMKSVQHNFEALLRRIVAADIRGRRARARTSSRTLRRCGRSSTCPASSRRTTSPSVTFARSSSGASSATAARVNAAFVSSSAS